MNISDITKIIGLTDKVVHFYEEKGLVTPSIRSENGYHTYTQQHLNGLVLLRQTRQTGFNLERGGKLMGLLSNPQRHSVDVRHRTLEKVAETGRHIGESQFMRDQLSVLTNAYPGGDNADYLIVKNLSGCCHHRTG